MDPHLPGTVPFTGVGCRPAPRAGSLDARIMMQNYGFASEYVLLFSLLKK
jgi:hypothetical protein